MYGSIFLKKFENIKYKKLFCGLTKGLNMSISYVNIKKILITIWDEFIFNLSHVLFLLMLFSLRYVWLYEK